MVAFMGWIVTGGVLACSWWCPFDFLGADCMLIVSGLLYVAAMVLRRVIDEGIDVCVRHGLCWTEFLITL